RHAETALDERKGHLSGSQETREQGPRATQLVSGQHRRRQALQLALSCRGSLSLHLRGRARTLVFAAARLSGDSAGPVHHGRFRSRVQDGEMVRRYLHPTVRAPGRHSRQLARPTENTRPNRCGTDHKTTNPDTNYTELFMIEIICVICGIALWLCVLLRWA